MYKRVISSEIAKRILNGRSVVLTGARQTGKTTLVKSLLPQNLNREVVYYSLDDPDIRQFLIHNSIARLNEKGNRIVILDEIQKLPILLDSVKVNIDSGSGNLFILLGSSQILLLKQVRETLAGRVTVVDLWPLSLAETTGQEELKTFLDVLWEAPDTRTFLKERIQSGIYPEKMRMLKIQEEELLLYGGYPALRKSENAEDKKLWLKDYRRTYLERDVSDLGRVSDLDSFAMAQKLVAARSGGIFNMSDIARDLSVSPPTVKRYLHYLEISYQAFFMQPYFANIAKRLTKNPKVYWSDCGLCRFLTDRWSLQEGGIYETLIADELKKWCTYSGKPVEMFFYNEHGGSEVDFILKDSQHTLALEVKASETVFSRDARHIEAFFKSTGLSGLGLVAYRGTEMFELSENVFAIPSAVLFGPDH